MTSSHSFHLFHLFLCATEQVKAHPTMCQKSEARYHKECWFAGSPERWSNSVSELGESFSDPWR
jgi:hypothetical protein